MSDETKPFSAGDSVDRVDSVDGRVRAWLEGAVIGLDLCPFAEPVVRSGRLHIEVCAARDPEGGLRAVLSEAMTLIATPASQRSTTLVVFPQGLEDFDTFLAVAESADDALEVSGASDLLQTATFHPDYVFADVDQDDLGNYTNRAPYPIVHLLRVEEVGRAVDGHPDPGGIPERNIATLDALGAKVIARLWATWGDLESQA